MYQPYIQHVNYNVHIDHNLIIWFSLKTRCPKSRCIIIIVPIETARFREFYAIFRHTHIVNISIRLPKKV